MREKITLFSDATGEPPAKKKKASIVANTESTINLDRLKHFQEITQFRSPVNPRERGDNGLFVILVPKVL